MRTARLHAITPEIIDGAALAAVDAVLGAGVRWVQARTKAGTDLARYEAVRAVVAIALRHGATCVVNDRADLALAAGAHGVHLGLDDVPVAAVRAMAPEGFVLGATVRDPDQARRAVAAGASYLGAGPVYPTGTKADLPDPIGLDGLAAVAAAAAVPVVAISGVTAERVPEVLAAGAHGVAVISALFARPDPAGAARSLLDALGGSSRDATGHGDPGIEAAG